MPLRLITQPSSEPLTLQQAKDHLRYEESRDDGLIEELIVAARQYLEQVCWRGLMSQVWELTAAGFRGEDRLELPNRGVVESGYPFGVGGIFPGYSGNFRFLPYLELKMGNLDELSPIEAFLYVDENGVTQTLATSVYDVDFASVPGRILLKYGQQYPNTRSQWNAVTLQYRVGWRTAAEVPAPIKHAMKLLISDMYERRSPTVLDEKLTTVSRLIQPYRLNSIG